MVQAAVPDLLSGGGGSIVCVGTRAALQPFTGAAGYISSKAAVIAFAQAVAVEYKHDGIRCNAILPSVIDTPGNRASMPKADFEKWVKPAQIAGVIAWLLSDASSPTSGAAMGALRAYLDQFWNRALTAYKSTVEQRPEEVG